MVLEARAKTSVFPNCLCFRLFKTLILALVLLAQYMSCFMLLKYGKSLAEGTSNAKHFVTAGELGITVMSPRLVEFERPGAEAQHPLIQLPSHKVYGREQGGGWCVLGPLTAKTPKLQQAISWVNLSALGNPRNPPSVTN